VRSVSRSVDRLSGTVLAGALMVAGSVLVAADRTSAGGMLMTVSGVAVLWVLLGGRRR